MKTKRINVEFEEVKVVNIMVDLGGLDSYMSRFLALKNHERETPEILEVRGFRDSNSVRITLLIDEDEIESDEIMKCRGYAEQFGLIERDEVDTAWIINRRDTDIDYRLDYNDWFIFY